MLCNEIFEGEKMKTVQNLFVHLSAVAGTLSVMYFIGNSTEMRRWPIAAVGFAVVPLACIALCQEKKLETLKKGPIPLDKVPPGKWYITSVPSNVVFMRQERETIVVDIDRKPFQCGTNYVLHEDRTWFIQDDPKVIATE